MMPGMPLTAWNCDTCHEDIEDPSIGVVIWRRSTDGSASGFLIVHKNFGGRDCDPGARAGYVSNIDLSDMIGHVGQARLLALLSSGPIRPGGVGSAELDSFVDVFRRLQTPWYEEARPRFEDELTHEWLDDANEVYPYIPAVLERIATGRLGS